MTTQLTEQDVDLIIGIDKNKSQSRYEKKQAFFEAADDCVLTVYKVFDRKLLRTLGYMGYIVMPYAIVQKYSGFPSDYLSPHIVLWGDTTYQGVKYRLLGFTAVINSDLAENIDAARAYYREIVEVIQNG